jgi:hypothetical protein
MEKGWMHAMMCLVKSILSRATAIICIIILSACNNAPPISVSELLKNAATHNGQMVTVKGCYSMQIETAVLYPCSDPKWEETIWVLPLSQIENSAKWIAGYADKDRKLENELTAREKRLAKQLSELADGVLVDVIFRGEFHSSDKPRFGHFAAYKYELILHRVLSIAPRKDR